MSFNAEHENLRRKEIVRLNDLNDDVLLMIFDYCTIDDLLNLAQVCERFQEIMSQSTFSRRSLDLLLVGHRNGDSISFQR